MASHEEDGIRCRFDVSSSSTCEEISSQIVDSYSSSNGEAPSEYPYIGVIDVTAAGESTPDDVSCATTFLQEMKLTLRSSTRESAMSELSTSIGGIIMEAQPHNGGGLEVINDDESAPVPLSQFEAGFQDKKDNNDRVRGLETIDDGDDAPVPFNDYKEIIHDKNDRVSGLEMIDDGEEPIFNNSGDGIYFQRDTIDGREEQPAPNIDDNTAASSITLEDEQRNIQQAALLMMRYLLWLFTGIEPPLPTENDSNRSPSNPVSRRSLLDLPPLLDATRVDDEETQIFHVAYDYSQQERGTVYEATQVEGEYTPFWKRYRRTACAVRALIFSAMVVTTVVTTIGRNGEDGTGPTEPIEPSDPPPVETKVRQ